jgi:glycosyltransferase involved in cell wall biosynthesis
MERLPYNILTISWDQTLAMTSPAFGDAPERHIQYGRQVNHLFSITYSKKNLNLRDKKLSDNVFVYPTNSSHPLLFIFKAKKIAQRICQENKIDLVLTQDPFLTGLVGVWIKKKFGCKLLVHYHGDFWHNSHWLKEHWYNFIFNFWQRLVLKRADALRVMSQGQREKFIQTGWSQQRIRVISTPVDLEKFLSLKVEDSGQKTVLHIGRDDQVKDYDTLVKAFGLVKNKFSSVEFWQLGAAGELEQAIKNNNFTDIKVLGLKPASQLIDFYQSANIIVLSSTSESFGKVLVEANACAKPVVSTATTGATEIIQDGVNGYLVPIKDYQALADRIIYLLEHPDQAKAMGERGRQLMKEKFGNNTEKIIKFWQDIITNNW